MKRFFFSLFVAFFASGCYSTRVLMPMSNAESTSILDRHVCATNKPTLSIAVTREPFTEVVNSDIPQTLAKKLANIFHETQLFSRISTGKESVESDYILSVIISEREYDIMEYFGAFALTIGLCPIPRWGYNASYTMNLDHAGCSWNSAALYERTTWIGWPNIILAPIVDPFCTRPTSRSILTSMIKDIQFQGGFDDLHMDVK